MSNIRVLPAEVVAQIKAGEVIERPISVVKELVENALDAHATSIGIKLTQGGLGAIKVSDNGQGMSQEDISLAVLPHATSKLRQVEDLLSLTSLGFRGEALASIAAVSQLIIQTKAADSVHGWQLRQAYGQVKELMPIGTVGGTTVQVTDLFTNMPVRQKFLQSAATELRHILRYVTHVAMAHPTVSWQVQHNGHVVLDLPATTKIIDRLTILWGRDIREHLLSVQYEEAGVTINGYITKPQAARAKAYHQYILINNRPVKQTNLVGAVREAYGTLLPPAWQPLFLLQVTVPANQVDVNIHPRKEEVALVQETDAKQAVVAAVKERLDQQQLTYQYHLDQAAGVNILRDAQADTTMMNLLRETADPWDVRTVLQPTSEIVQIHKLYLIAPTQRGLVLIDQHAAHERILYEQFLEQFTTLQTTGGSQELSQPVLVEVALSEAGALTEQLPILQQVGFIIEHFGQQTFKVTAVPPWFIDRDIPALLHEVLADLVTQPGGATSLDHVSHKTIAYLACRSAIKAGDSLSLAERQNLLEKLSQTKTQYTCPHGRPVQVEMTLPELHRLFKRS